MIRVCRCQASSPPPLPTLLISMVGFFLLLRDTTKSHYICHGLHAGLLLQEERQERSKTSSLIISKLMQEVDVLVSASVCSPRICFKCTLVQRAEVTEQILMVKLPGLVPRPVRRVGGVSAQTWMIGTDAGAPRENPDRSDASQFFFMSSKTQFPRSLSRPRWDIFLEALAKMKHAQLQI